VADLTEYKLSDDVVYGPVRSRRLGRSLGVNVLPFNVKVCSFNCNYCQCGWTYDTTDHATLQQYTWPTPKEIEDGVGRRLAELGGKVDSITFAGNGEPTLHPEFSDCVRGVLRARERHAPKAKVDILSNGSHMDRADVVEGLNLLDERYIKLDAGDEATFMDMNTPVMNVSLEEIVGWVGQLRDFVGQSMFCRGRIDNTTDAAVDAWVRTCAAAKPKSVQVYSISRFPADARLTTVPRERLEQIAARLRDGAKIPAEVF
jgi:wyosine [tRNA(Phe)-imidazoG37] synthetase (radical SAM superfamily)